MADERDQIAEAFEICKLQASVDDTFDERLMRNWFQAAWDLCAEMIGLMPPTQIEEPIIIRMDGSFVLSHVPTSPVQIYDRYRLVMTLPPTLERSFCDPSLCCLCNLWVRYMIGQETCEVPARFIQAVARVFAYIVENRGDSELDREVLAKCGALTFLGPDLEYVA